MGSKCELGPVTLLQAIRAGIAAGQLEATLALIDDALVDLEARGFKPDAGILGRMVAEMDYKAAYKTCEP